MRAFRIALVSACLVAACAFAIDARAQASTADVDGLRDRFPASSIDSVPKADAALAATVDAKARVEKDYKAATTACLKEILVNACLDAARAVQRKRNGDIGAIEIEANRLKRKDKADRVEADRAKREAERTEKAPSDAAARERSRQVYEGKQADAAKQADDRAKSGTKRAASASRAHKPAVKLATPASADPAQRAKNAADFAAHQQSAKAHQVDMDRRLIEKTADRKRRADAKAAKDARTAAAAAAASPAAGKP